MRVLIFWKDDLKSEKRIKAIQNYYRLQSAYLETFNDTVSINQVGKC